MRKSDLVQTVAERAEINPRQAEAVLSAFIEQVTNALSRGEVVNLVGFGAFTVRERVARTGRNPKTGAPLAIEASLRPVFRPGKALKAVLHPV